MTRPPRLLGRRRVLAGLTGLAGAGLAGCSLAPSRPGSRAGVAREIWGTMPGGDPVSRFTLTNDQGATAQIITYGAAVTSLRMPDRQGRLGEVVLGLDSLADYLARSRNFGTLVGRYAGRIAYGRFPLDGRMVQLAPGGGKHTSHGGPEGFAKRNWQAEAASDRSGPAVRLSLVSPDGDQGFPGTLTIAVTYRLRHDQALVLEIEATTDAPTVLNPTHHSYFNLGDDHARPINDHLLMIEADRFTVYGPDKRVTGELRLVAGTPLDFRTAKPIGQDLVAEDPQMRIGNGYDHCFVISGGAGRLRRAVRAWDPGSGRALELWTTEPGVQLFTANGLDMVGRGGVPYRPQCGFCLEPQHFHDSPNQPDFPSTLLRPGEQFRSHSEYRFSTLA